MFRSAEQIVHEVGSHITQFVDNFRRGFPCKESVFAALTKVSKWTA